MSIAKNQQNRQVTTDPAIALYQALHRKRIYTKLYWDVANTIGIYEALLIEIVERWCEWNQDRGKTSYFHQGAWWTSATYQEWAAKYPKLGSWKSIQRIFLKLEKNGYILSGQFTRGSQIKYYRVNPKSIGDLLLSGTLSQDTGTVSNSDSTVSNSDSTVSNSDGTISDLDHPPYIDQIIQIDHSNTFPPTPQGESEKEITPVSVEILDAEDSVEVNGNQPTLITPCPENNNYFIESCSKSKNYSVGSNVPGACDNNTKNNCDVKPEKSYCHKELVEELIDKFEAGEITKLPTPELKLLADEIIGDTVALYRRSKNIVAIRANDINQDFLDYLAQNYLTGDLKGNLAKARSMVRNKEQDRFQWGSLVDMVNAWQDEIAKKSNQVTFVDENGQELEGATAECAAALASDPMLQIFMSLGSKHNDFR